MEFIAHWIQQYGYLGLFSLLMMGIVGLPIPDETVLMFTGYLVYKEDLHFLLALLAAFLGSICGISMSYLLGRSLGLLLIKRIGKYLFITPEKIDRVHGWLRKHGKWSLLFGYYLPGIRHLTAYIAGTTCLEYRTFATFAYLGGLVWSATFIVLGYSLGEEWQKVVVRLHGHLVLSTIILVAVLLLFWLLKKKLVKL